MRRSGVRQYRVDPGAQTAIVTGASSGGHGRAASRSNVQQQLRTIVGAVRGKTWLNRTESVEEHGPTTGVGRRQDPEARTRNNGGEPARKQVSLVRRAVEVSEQGLVASYELNQFPTERRVHCCGTANCDFTRWTMSPQCAVESIMSCWSESHSDDQGSLHGFPARRMDRRAIRAICRPGTGYHYGA